MHSKRPFEIRLLCVGLERGSKICRFSTQMCIRKPQQMHVCTFWGWERRRRRRRPLLYNEVWNKRRGKKGTRVKRKCCMGPPTIARAGAAYVMGWTRPRASVVTCTYFSDEQTPPPPSRHLQHGSQRYL